MINRDDILLFTIVCLVSSFIALGILEFVDQKLDERSTRRVFELHEVKK